VKLTRRGAVALCTAGAALGFGTGPLGYGVPANGPSESKTTRVEVYEDGSGVQYINGRRVRVFEEDTFVWDCKVMGNRKCGPK